MSFSRRVAFSILASVSVAATPSTTFAQSPAPTTRKADLETLETRVGGLDFDLGVPTRETVAKLYDEMDFQRAALCYLWATPIVGMEGVREALADNAGAKSGDLVLVEGYRDVSVMLGSNLTTPYFLAYIDLSHGPMVV